MSALQMLRRRCGSCERSTRHIAELDALGQTAAAALARNQHAWHVEHEHGQDTARLWEAVHEAVAP